MGVETWGREGREEEGATKINYYENTVTLPDTLYISLLECKLVTQQKEINPCSHYMWIELHK